MAYATTLKFCFLYMKMIFYLFQGAESLLMNGIAHTLCISFAGLVSLPDPGPEWRKAWLLGLKLTTALLHSTGHQFVSHTLDFVCVHWDKLSTVSQRFQFINSIS